MDVDPIEAIFLLLLTLVSSVYVVALVLAMVELMEALS
jgi:hypothetical protein